MLAVLGITASGETMAPHCVPEITRRFSLLEADIHELSASGRQIRLMNRVHWAKTRLQRAGLVESVR